MQYINLHYFRTTHISDTKRKEVFKKIMLSWVYFLLEFVILLVMFDSKLGKNYISVIGKGPFSELGRVRSRNWERPVPIGNGSVYRTQLKKEKKRCQITSLTAITSKTETRVTIVTNAKTWSWTPADPGYSRLQRV